MPRSNRPRGRAAARAVDDDTFGVSRSLTGRLHTEEKRDGSWNVQPIAAPSATKTYTCPGCALVVGPRTAHVVAWRADGLMGAEDDLAARRHWHSHCWTIRR